MAVASARGAAAGPSGAEAKISKPLPMVTMLAYRNLFHDRLSLIVTLVGIVFSVVLVAVLCGLYLGAETRITAMLDHSEADLWVVPLGTKSFDDPAPLPGREKYLILSTPGVADSDELVVRFVTWRKFSGGTTVALLVGSDTQVNKSLPWNIVEGSIADLSAPSAIAVDNTYFQELGIKRRGDRAEINNQEVTVAAVTKGIRSFTTLPYIFTTASTARTLAGATRDQASYVMVRLAPGSDVEQVRSQIERKLPNTEVLTQYEFRKRSQDYWLFETGAGSAIIAAALLGVVVGVVVVAQTLYASTKEHLNEFATLRALGASAGFIRKVILIQAVLSAGMGYAIGILLSLVVIWAFKDTTLLIVMTVNLAIALLVLTVFMCVFAAICAIFKVTRIDPAVVFSR
jgi:putative ABC transport system permease protein